MAFSLIPTHVRSSIYDIDYRVLADRGVKLVLADLDNTLTPYSQGMPTQELKDWLKELKALGMTLFVVSNSRKSRRCHEFCAALDVPFVRHAGKPKRAGYERAMKQMGCTPEQTIMLGDQIFTDVLGANRVGVEVCLVDPIEFGTVFRVIRYGIEQPFRILGRKNG